jgi:hypothetical protein
VFGADADVLVLTADTLEQAGRPTLAARRARRLLSGEVDSAADLGCASGTDTIALARAGASVLAVDTDPLARELTAANVEALGVADRVWVVAGDAVELVDAARGGEVAGCGAAVLDPARRAGGRRQLDPDRWSPPWSTVATLLDRAPARWSRWRRAWTTSGCRPASRRSGCRPAARSSRRCCGAGRCRLGPAAGVPRARRRRAGADRDADPGPAPSGPVRGWLLDPTRGDPVGPGVAGRRRPRRHAGRPDDRLPDLDARPAPRGCPRTGRRGAAVQPQEAEGAAADARVGRVVVKKRGSAVEPETLARQLRGEGAGTATVVVTRVAGAPTALVCDIT